MAERRDALRNRTRLVESATVVFGENGAAAPLDLVARHAGVGRGTLYRHFPNRVALVAAVLDQRVHALETLASSWADQDVLERVLVEMFWFQRDVPGLVSVLRAQPEEGPTSDDGLTDILDRTRTLLTAALRRGLGSGVVRRGTTLADVYLLVAMVDGAVSLEPDMPVRGPLDRAFALLLRGLRPAERIDLPIPSPVLRRAASQTGT